MFVTLSLRGVTKVQGLHGRKIILFFLFFFASICLAPSQESDIGLAYKQIDSAFVHESADELSGILKSYRSSRDYYLCEAYALKKTRQYIIQDKLDFARAAALTVIDNNIDNFDAIDLYSYIDKAVLAKEAERQARQQDGEPVIGLHSVQEQASEVEGLLIQQIIRHGEIIIVDEDTEDAGPVRFNVAQYINYDFGNDGLAFCSELYNRILREAVDHSSDGGFKAETYFIQHPDLEVSQLAHHMAVDNYQLGRNFQKEVTPKDLRQMVDHLILDFRYNYMKKRVQEITDEMKTEKDMARIKELMDEYQSTSELYRQIGKMLGR